MENNEGYYHTMVEIDGVYFDALLNQSEIKEGVQRAIDYPSMINPHGQCVDCVDKEHYCSVWSRIMGTCPKGGTYGS